MRGEKGKDVGQVWGKVKIKTESESLGIINAQKK